MNLAPKVTAKLKARADKYAEAMREELTDLLSEGLIDGDAYTAIAKKGEFYSLRDYIEKIDPDDKIMIGGSKRDIRGSGLHKLGEGAEKLLENDHVKLLEEVVTRTQRQILNNRAAQSLYDLAVVVKDQAKNPKSKIIKNLVTLAKEGEDPPPGYVELYAMVEGKREPLWIREELAKEYLDKIDADFQKQLNWIGWMSGAKMLKLTATGANPAFAITSIMRDTFYSAGFYEGYSGTFFKAIPELLTDMVQVFPDVIAKEGRYIEAARDGMLQNMLTAEGRVEGLKGPLDKAQTVMGYLSQLTEDLIRFSVRERGIKNGLSPKEASFDARNLLDFHQHGKTVKVLDAGIPYLNAAIQGTRGMMRYAKNNPGKFIWKMTELGVASGLLYKWNTQGVGSSQCYDSISAAEKSKFFIFCTPMAPKKDKDGNDRYAYFRIPKDQGQQIFTPLFDFLAAQTVPDREWDSDTLWEAFLGGLPVSDTSFSPPINNMFEAFQNHSTFFRSDIWRGPEVERYQEYNKRTHPLSIMIGDLTAGVDEETGKKVGGISPARLEAGIATIIAQNNPAPKLLAYFMKKALDENDEMSNEDVYNKYFPVLPRVVKYTAQVPVSLIKKLILSLGKRIPRRK